ncbi:glucosamine inositolphosphorylceramide transferase family protein [Algoriphagus winogradskyi]|uniref:Glucosamine inositolphosphorylceramide transferase 1 N-terminal domain-containing protein n=1 Tax=Algoriphagus winogradskyi TaxID=237017 RepID=A0ABY1NXC7_9BACT|nr:hypothetical protein [Algoriphagus winogradskyi]SMP20019.1 hypothetical protein SAMN06265367_10359 [Algoriphagus winogradskyi]
MTYLKKVKIGILTKPFTELDPWEISLFEQLLELDFLEISALIFDGRPQDTHSAKPSLLSRLWPGNFLWRWQQSIEKKLFVPVSVESEKVRHMFDSVDKLEMFPRRKGFVDFFEEADTEKIKQLDLDIILRHEFNIIKGAILNASKYGVWSLHHGDNFVNRGGPAGFWEIVEGHEAIGVTLQQLTPELDGGKIIEKAFYNINWSHNKNRQFIQFSSIQLVLKNIRKVRHGKFSIEESLTYSHALYRSPGPMATLKYLGKFYKVFLSTLISKLAPSKRENLWKLYLGKGDFLHAALFRVKEIPLPEGEFWADPFLFEKEGKKYLFFERYKFDKGIACISVGQLENGKVTDVQDVIDDGTHMSYPNVFEDQGEIYMIPETCAKKRLEVYRATDFPYKWELYSTAFEGVELADVNFFRDELGKAWIFFSKGFWFDLNSDLYIYQIDSLKMDTLYPHLQNPVIIDSRIARNGGKIYKRDGKYFRPSQRNVNGNYGFGLNINQIVELTLEEYKEEKIVSAYPSFMPKLTGFHHVDSHEKFFIIDAAKRRG